MRPLRKHFRDLRGDAALSTIAHRWRRPRRGRPHELAAPLIVSLTSYPPRFPTLAPTLQCLLSQSVEPNRVLLWIAADDMARLPDDVLSLCDHGLEILPTEDLGSFKKIIPALKRFPGCYIATADDDVFYGRTWLEELVDAAADARSPREIFCWRAHQIKLGADGAPLSYTLWRRDISACKASPLIFPTGIGGVLYPPRSLHPSVLDAARFQQLCPTSDDIWLYWMARMNGAQFRKVGPRRSFVCWPKSQAVALQDGNAVLGGGNDIQFAAMARAFGKAWRQEFRHVEPLEPSRAPAPQRRSEMRFAARGNVVGGAGSGRSISF